MFAAGLSNATARRCRRAFKCFCSGGKKVLTKTLRLIRFWLRRPIALATSLVRYRTPSSVWSSPWSAEYPVRVRCDWKIQRSPRGWSLWSNCPFRRANKPARTAIARAVPFLARPHNRTLRSRPELSRRISEPVNASSSTYPTAPSKSSTFTPLYARPNLTSSASPRACMANRRQLKACRYPLDKSSELRLRPRIRGGRCFCSSASPHYGTTCAGACDSDESISTTSRIASSTIDASNGTRTAER